MKILHIISSPRAGTSITHKLGSAIVDKLKAVNANSTVVEHDLAKMPFPHLEEVHLNSFFTSIDNYTPELVEAVKHSDEAVAELDTADVIVIGAPMYNFSIPSSLKAWIDHIARAGKTFNYTEAGPQGLIKNKKIYLAISSGGVYSKGVMQSYDFIESYLRAILGFLGMTDITTFRVEGMSMPNLKDDAWKKALQNIEDEFMVVENAA